MEYEYSRQLIHLGGLVFIILAQFTGRSLISLVFFLIALAFLIYSEFVKREKGFGPVSVIENKIRGVAVKLERDVSRPFTGAFWFYFGLGLTFLIFPLGIATIAGLILSISDSFSTMTGMKYGKHKMIGSKSLEGSLVFFVSSFLITVFLLDFLLGVETVGIKTFVVALTAFLVSISTTFMELVPEAKKIKKWKRKEIVDDNWIIPLFSGLVVYVAYILTAAL